MEQLLFKPVKDISRTAYWDGIKKLPQFSAVTKNKRGFERLVTLVKTGRGYFDAIIDGVHHTGHERSLEARMSLFFGDEVAKLFKSEFEKL